MRNKAKTWGVIGKLSNTKQKLPKSQLQTVLITASGPQAYNALVHRERYTQGSRQNRCVSSQEALALRARARGTGAASVCVGAAGSLLLSWGSPPRHGASDRVRRVKATVPGVRVTPGTPLGTDSAPARGQTRVFQKAPQ